jgi:serine/threonine protein kinase
VPIAIGSRLGPYEIVSPLGAGGMGEVYRAHDTKLNRDVAIKVPLRPSRTIPIALRGSAGRLSSSRR